MFTVTYPEVIGLSLAEFFAFCKRIALGPFYYRFGFTDPLGIEYTTEELHTAWHVARPKVFDGVQPRLADFG